jgi:hypothetical protein
MLEEVLSVDQIHAATRKRKRLTKIESDCPFRKNVWIDVDPSVAYVVVAAEVETNGKIEASSPQMSNGEDVPSAHE